MAVIGLNNASLGLTFGGLATTDYFGIGYMEYSASVIGQLTLYFPVFDRFRWIDNDTKKKNACEK